MGVKEEQRRERKRRLFRRDGWQDRDGAWFAMCAHGCGEVIGWHTATIELYPTRKCDGGTYRHDNTRLICRPCDEKCNGRRKWRGPNLPPQPISVSANIDRLIESNARREARASSPDQQQHSGKLEALSESGPGGAGNTVTPGLTTTKEWLMADRTRVPRTVYRSDA